MTEQLCATHCRRVILLGDDLSPNTNDLRDKLIGEIYSLKLELITSHVEFIRHQVGGKCTH